MRAGLLLPACIVLSAVVHVLLVAAVAVPRQATTSHGESIAVDIVPANEVPELPEVPESQPAPEMPTPTPHAELPAAKPPEPAQPPAPPQQQPQRQQPPRQQAQQQPQQKTQPQQQPPQQSQPQPQQPQQQASQPEQPTPAAPAPGSTLAEQQERLMAMLNLQGPNTGDGSGSEAETKAHLTPQEIAAFRAHLKSCWQLPQGVSPNQKLKVVVRMSLKQNGSLSSDPALIEAGISPIGPPLVQAAMKAIKQCQPYTMLPGSKYKEWRILDINFSPDEMAKG
jgi:outer membrane biosynthesis protein TonB